MSECCHDEGAWELASDVTAASPASEGSNSVCRADFEGKANGALSRSQSIDLPPFCRGNRGGWTCASGRLSVHKATRRTGESGRITRVPKGTVRPRFGATDMSPNRESGTATSENGKTVYVHKNTMTNENLKRAALSSTYSCA
jgi:hypothetical protein